MPPFAYILVIQVYNKGMMRSQWNDPERAQQVWKHGARVRQQWVRGTVTFQGREYETWVNPLNRAEFVIPDGIATENGEK